jgi:Protease subunit of ATP-dependent Clp proteases
MNKKKETTVRFFGTIGSDINGDQFANELAALDKEYDVINLHINSSGGDVPQGYSIVSVILSMKATVNVYVVGIAASMAAVAAVCGNKVYMYDYSRLMIHDPFFSGRENKKLSEKEKEVLSHITDSLQMILSRRGKDKAKIAQLMKVETWFNADQALSEGLIDCIVSTKHKNEFSRLSNDDILTRISAKYQPNKTNINMKLLNEMASLLDIENPTEETVLQAVKDLIQASHPVIAKNKLDLALDRSIIGAGSYSNLLEMGNSAPEALNDYLAKLEKEYEKAQEEKINAFFTENKQKLTYINLKGREGLKELAKKDFDLFTRLMSVLPDSFRLSELIRTDNKTNVSKTNWTLDDYRKNAPEELKSNPNLYEKLVELENKKK